MSPLPVGCSNTGGRAQYGLKSGTAPFDLHTAPDLATLVLHQQRKVKVTHTISGKHLAERVIVDFAGELGLDFWNKGHEVREAEVIHAEGPDGLGDFVDAYVKPLAGGMPLHVRVDPESAYALLG